MNSVQGTMCPPAAVARAGQYQLTHAWPSPTESARADVVRFWGAEGALPDRVAAEARSHELLIVARDGGGHVAGVSTAMRVWVEQLGFECFYYRTLVGRAARTRGLRSTELVWDILRASYRVLNQRFLQGFDREVLGIYAEMENPSIMRNCDQAVWQNGGMNFVFIGRTPDGRHKRVWYFEGARVP